MTTDNFNPPNSVWPNGLKRDEEGYVTFYPLGTNKVNVPTSSTQWPKGNKLVSPFVYQDDKLVGFIDTKAFTTDSQTLIYLPYTHIEAEFSAIDKGQLQIHAPKATTKKVSWKDSGVEDIPEAQFKYKGCKTRDNVKTVDANYQTTDIVDGIWSEPLWDLTNGNYTFAHCLNLKSFNSDLPSLTDVDSMFDGTNLTSFSSDLSSLTSGTWMFYECKNLTSFSSNLSSLTSGNGIFYGCKLDTPSVQNIADTIKDVNGLENEPPRVWKYIDVGIGNTIPNEQEEAAFNTMVSKGWTVYANGSEYTPTSPAAITTLDENGEETVTPIPFYAKPVQTDEQHAKYIDGEGNFFNILGAQFIYGDDLSTYGMFTCEADAAANMRLTPYVKSQTEIENQ